MLYEIKQCFGYVKIGNDVKFIVILENELIKTSTKRKFGISEFSTRLTNYYNIDMLITIAFLVRTDQGTKFRVCVIILLIK